MLQRMYKGLDQNVFTTNRQPEPIIYIEDLEVYNEQEGLALSKEEMDYLKKVEMISDENWLTPKYLVSHRSTPNTAATKFSGNVYHRRRKAGIFPVPDD